MERKKSSDSQWPTTAPSVLGSLSLSTGEYTFAKARIQSAYCNPHVDTFCDYENYFVIVFKR